jgi:hypothetical protein
MSGTPIHLWIGLFAQNSQSLTLPDPNSFLADDVHYQGLTGGRTMALSKKELIQELKHEIYSPLAAIRNALYLAAIRSSDTEILRYLELADTETSRIADILQNANQIDEKKRLQITIPFRDVASAA